MKLWNAQAMALSLMKRHGLYGWSFCYMKRVKKFNRAGQCSYRRQTIELSPVFVELNYPIVVKWTILHEIAHAIAGAKHGHNKFWKKTAKDLGHRGNTCYGSYVKRR